MGECVKNKKRKEALSGYLFILPLFAGLGIFFFWSFFQNFWFSFTNRTTFGETSFIGLDNYTRLFADPRLPQAVWQTLQYVFLSVPAIIILALVLANWLNMKIKFKGIYRTLIFLPAVTMPAAIGLIWRGLMNYQFGIINAALGVFGIEGVPWLADPRFVIPAISIVLIWSNVGYQMILFLAGMQGIGRTYYEAAEIDGASPTQQFFKITLPLLSPVIFFVMITTIIQVIQVFDFIILMIRYPSAVWGASRSLVSWFFEESFRLFNHGYGAAIAMVLFVIIMVFTAVQMFLQRKWVHYD